jgi:hypothetical protein
VDFFNPPAYLIYISREGERGTATLAARRMFPAIYKLRTLSWNIYYAEKQTAEVLTVLNLLLETGAYLCLLQEVCTKTLENIGALLTSDEFKAWKRERVGKKAYFCQLLCLSDEQLSRLGSAPLPSAKRMRNAVLVFGPKKYVRAARILAQPALYLEDEGRGRAMFKYPPVFADIFLRNKAAYSSFYKKKRRRGSVRVLLCNFHMPGSGDKDTKESNCEEAARLVNLMRNWPLATRSGETGPADVCIFGGDSNFHRLGSRRRTDLLARLGTNDKDLKCSEKDSVRLTTPWCATTFSAEDTPAWEFVKNTQCLASDTFFYSFSPEGAYFYLDHVCTAVPTHILLAAKPTRFSDHLPVLLSLKYFSLPPKTAPARPVLAAKEGKEEEEEEAVPASQISARPIPTAAAGTSPTPTKEGKEEEEEAAPVSPISARPIPTAEAPAASQTAESPEINSESCR